MEAIAFQTPPLDFYKNIRTKFNPVGRESKGFQVAQLVKNPLAMQETLVQSIGKFPMERG